MIHHLLGLRRWTDCLNALALLGISGVLWFAFAWQIVLYELPCPLCLLQRVGFAMAGIGLMLNVCFGSRPAHYGIAILSALAGMVSSARQVLLHIAPGDPGFGSPFLGLHFYTWALVAFFVLGLFLGGLLLLDPMKVKEAADVSRTPGWLGKLAVYSFLAILLVTLLSTLLECGFGPCPDDPTEYLWLPGK
ncbi:disulfide bond formation protein B [Microbulbifer elongatus]|uniref:Disulfide bond formation protein B n=1 Tax=Microbulbifer elongatus TaxID=86173 RepID=A0ABT1P1X1_9GAMM|nr:disulfide bond formation protein B [Microbulbifer elongatus]